MPIEKSTKTSRFYNCIANQLYNDYTRTTLKTTNQNLCNWHSPLWAIIHHELCTYIERKELSNCLECLEAAGFTEERALLMLAAAQLVGGAV